MTWESSVVSLPASLFAAAALLEVEAFLGLTLDCALKLDMREVVMDSVGLGDGLLPSFACFSCTLFHGGTYPFGVSFLDCTPCTSDQKS